MRNMKKKRPSLQDIADRVGTTKMTVSRCLRNPHSVSEALRSEIFAVAEALNYLPNQAPVLLAQATSRSIGVLVPSVTNQVFSEVLAGVIDVTDRAGYRVMISHYGYQPEMEERSLASLVAYNVDGLILSDRQHTEHTRRLLAATEVPVVEIMDTRTPALQQAVGYDNHQAAYDMVAEMIASGRRNIVYLAVRLDERTLQRRDGYNQAMEDHGLEPRTLQSVLKSSFSVGSTLMARVLAEDPDTDGVFCTNDDVAVGVYFECQRQGVQVPADMAIAGFHGHDVGQAMVPRLASVITPRHDIGTVAAEHLLRRVAGEEIRQTVINLGYSISRGGTLD